MSKRQPSPFQVGQLTESRSLIPGYRGAWFRCEIKEVAWNKGQPKYHVRYYDYDDDGLEWLSLHKVVKGSDGSTKPKRELMLRPQFPPVYHESELPDMDAVSGVAVVVDGCWSVGDMVDWLEDGCYWRGTITKFLGDDTVEIKLPDEPVGEGLTYFARFKDLRPSLCWYPDSGWTFPEGQNSHSHARLIQPLKQASIPKSLGDVVEEGNQNTKTTPRSSDSNDSISSHTSASSLPLLSRLIPSRGSPKRVKDIPGKDREQTHGESKEIDAGGCSDSMCSTFVGHSSAEIPVASSAEKKDPEDLPAKKQRVYWPIPLNSTSCDNIESAIMDLEEVVCRVKWLKRSLKFGNPSTSPNDKWEFLDHPTVPEPT